MPVPQRLVLGGQRFLGCSSCLILFWQFYSHPQCHRCGVIAPAYSGCHGHRHARPGPVCGQGRPHPTPAVPMPTTACGLSRSLIVSWRHHACQGRSQHLWHGAGDAAALRPPRSGMDLGRATRYPHADCLELTKVHSRKAPPHDLFFPERQGTRMSAVIQGC